MKYMLNPSNQYIVPSFPESAHSGDEPGPSILYMSNFLKNTGRMFSEFGILNSEFEKHDITDPHSLVKHK